MTDDINLPELPEQAAAAWVIPGDDGGSLREWVDAKLFRDGEFTEPLFSTRQVRAAQRAAVLADREQQPNLWPVIFWLEGGCNPWEAAKELRIYAERMKTASPTPPAQSNEDRELDGAPAEMSLPPFNPRPPQPPKADPGEGDDVACVKCGAVALDTGLECSECGSDNYEAITGKPFLGTTGPISVPLSGYKGSVLCSDSTGHVLHVEFDSREQADAAQAWLASEPVQDAASVEATTQKRALERQRRLVATLPQTSEQAALLTPAGMSLFLAARAPTNSRRAAMAEAVHSEKIGQLADRVDNLVHALQLPLPPALHVQQLREALPQIRDALRLIYTAQMGEDPWETHPRGVDIPGEGKR